MEDTGSNSRAKNSGKEVDEEMSPIASPPQEHGIVLTGEDILKLMILVDIDITPLLTHPDRQRSRKLLESCLREINYLMSQPTSLPPSAMNHNINTTTDNHPSSSAVSQEWPQRDMHLQSQSSSEEISYIGIDNDPPPQDEELPRKLPKKVPLLTTSSTTSSTAESNKPQDSSIPPPPEQIPRPPSPKLNTVLERTPAAPRSTAKSAFQDSPSSTQHHLFKDPTPPFPNSSSTTRLKSPPPSSSSSRTFTNIHTLRSHLLPVRSLIPCNTASTLPDETCFISAGDDSTVKFWRVNNRPAGAVGGNFNTRKKAGNFDILPQITFRGHSGMVTCLAEGEGFIWSGGVDAAIRGWCVPPGTRDAYGSSGTRISPPAMYFIALSLDTCFVH
jgi:striatin 1/3/4